MTTLDFDSKTNTLNISADCRDVNPGLKIEVLDPELPVEHGTKITYRCLKQHMKIGGDATCQNGTISFSNGVPPCVKPGNTGLLQLYLSLYCKEKFSYL